jgi:RNA polymerase sigma factor (sigma-70 family)
MSLAYKLWQSNRLCSVPGCGQPATCTCAELCHNHEIRYAIVAKYACDMMRASTNSTRLLPSHDLARNIVWRMVRLGECGDDFDAEDLFSAAYEGLMNGAMHLDLTKSEGEQVNYLITCIENRVRDYLRVERRYREWFVCSIEDLNEDGKPRDDNEPDYRPLRSSDWKRTELQICLKSMISKMPDKYQRVFELKFNDPTVTAAEIAEQLNMSVKTVESLLARGRKMLPCAPGTRHKLF